MLTTAQVNHPIEYSSGTTSADQHLSRVTSEKANTEQRPATQNNARRHRSATQRATRRQDQSTSLPCAEPDRHGQTIHNSAVPSRRDGTLDERSRSQPPRGARLDLPRPDLTRPDLPMSERLAGVDISLQSRHNCGHEY
jgi:hypothetical protein